jgi:uncharacterized protein (DUF885 family)
VNGALDLKLCSSVFIRVIRVIRGQNSFPPNCSTRELEVKWGKPDIRKCSLRLVTGFRCVSLARMISIRSSRRYLALFPIFVTAISFSAPAQTAYERDCDKLAADTRPDGQRLNELFKLNWDYSMHENPEWATDVGYPGLNDRWTDESLDAIARRRRELQAPLKVLNSINRTTLTPADQLNYDLFRKGIEDGIEGSRFKGEYLAIHQMGGVQQNAAETLVMAPHRTVKDYENMIARLNTLPQLIDQTLVLLNLGLETGITEPRITLRDVPQQVKDQTEKDPAKNPLLKPFQEFPPEIPEAERARLRQEATTALHEKVIPAFDRLYKFLVDKYLPGARQSIALSDLPDGKAWYAFNVRTRTTTSMTPEQIHELGLAEVDRIRGEMDKVMAQTGFKGNFKKFSSFLRKDPRFFYKNKDDLLSGYRDIAKRIDPELIRFFGKLPRLPYGVLPVPAYSEKSQTTAYYQSGSLKAGRPGYFYANTYALNTRPKWEMEALTSHEAVPGHHLQISLAQEMENEPEFRKHGGYTAFVEGWGLYAEGLSEEMGLYKDPYSKYGQLTYEMWRAIRLVVDTGMHSLGWTREQSISYFLANTSKTEHDVTVEIDRYIVMPGQALAYKLGQLKFRELRAYATAELGDKFDVRAFHDQVLANGALPLDVLDTRFKEWVAEQRTGTNRAKIK